MTPKESASIPPHSHYPSPLPGRLFVPVYNPLFLHPLVLPIPLGIPKSVIYTPKRGNEYPRSFHMGDPLGERVEGAWFFICRYVASKEERYAFFLHTKCIRVLKVITPFCIAHPFCSLLMIFASLACAHPEGNRFPMRVSSPEKKMVIYSNTVTYLFSK